MFCQKCGKKLGSAETCLECNPISDERKSDISGGEESESVPLNKANPFILWMIPSLIISIILAYVYVTSTYIPISGGRTFFSVVVGTFAGAIGATIGNKLRKIAKPDMIFTKDGMSGILAAKLFWAIGPQLVGLVIGAMCGVSLVLGAL